MMGYEMKRCLGHMITYFLAAVVLIIMYAVKQTPVGLFGGILCAGIGLKYLRDYRYLREKSKKDS